MSDPDRQATFVEVGASDGADEVDREEGVAWAAAAKGISGDEQTGTEARHGAGAIGVDGDTVGEDGGGHLCSAEFAAATRDDLVGCGQADPRTFHRKQPCSEKAGHLQLEAVGALKRATPIGSCVTTFLVSVTT